ncbi:MAG: SpoIIE family protein phosphatase [Planctomycetes bacterium]|nr:SpoIIE family protein phosphatase [Planctomycetota bacterium]
MDDLSTLGASDIIDSLTEGIYVCDPERRIVHWSRSAERITGWSADDVVGRHCFDSVLCHVDKDGHQLCGKEYCPLHRAMVTGIGTPSPLLVYALSKDGGRIPMRVSTAPIRNASGEVIGGVETFQDATNEVHDLERAKAIQGLALARDLPVDERVLFLTHYIPQDVIGGDYYAVGPLDRDRYGIMLADVTGHGIAAALYTMHLSQLWERCHEHLVDPMAFASEVNAELVTNIKSDSSFATAVCGVLDLGRRTFRFVGAGGPPVLLMHADGSHELLARPGLPFAISADAEYQEVHVDLRPGDHLLLFSDGAFEVPDADGVMLGLDGFLDVLRGLGYPQRALRMDALEEALLRHSNAIRLPDDLTLIEIRLPEA